MELIGIGYASSQKLQFADVMVSDRIENCVQVKWENGEITNRGARPPVDLDLKRIFCQSARKDWEDQVPYCTANDSRRPCLHVGCIVSAPLLMRDPDLKDRLLEHIPEAIGGEMEGWALLTVKDNSELDHHRVGIIIIKGVADYGDTEKKDNWQLTAAKAAVDYTHFRLKKTEGTEFQGKHILLSIVVCIPVLCYLNPYKPPH